MGFGIPIDVWICRELRPMLQDLLLHDARTAHLYQPGAVAAILEEHWSGRVNWCYVIWTMLALEFFWRQWQPTWTAPHAIG